MMDVRVLLQEFSSSPGFEPVAGFQVRVVFQGGFAAEPLTTCIVEASPQARLPYHTHPTGEAIVVLEGVAYVFVQGRRYKLSQWDTIYVPADVAHSVMSADSRSARLATAFPTAQVTRTFVEDHFTIRDMECAGPDDPETVVRWRSALPESLADGMVSWNLFGSRAPATHICGGTARFEPGSRLPCHRHDFCESITILEGEATCMVAGTRYRLGPLDTIGIGAGVPHYFSNHGSQPMTMWWVYAANEPSRTVLPELRCCAPDDTVVVHEQS